ncbi:uncharacterized protein SCHCODRAFT_02581147 [Schizophyllum commune H4-8]|uniref:uncharacterized protein n=1 Tax=Schizophyllum commune (strain H4-8 / FGSC 9210) TaxID=578458 RepID=UPI00215F7B8F|nr:uncharacterized protein SCHCODRAFT_02581147 [Schizophyllum commune H4-8]KAI5891428.1 hypothetical protein SCHCODRAFT_02581147 [Schizophyllum commune H4-8]
MDIYKIINTLTNARVVANASLHRSGYAPTTQDVVLIQQAADDLPPLVDMVDQEIQKLVDLKYAIQKQKEMHGALVAPYRRLPREILSMIFVLALPDGWYQQRIGKRVFNCLSVCAAWRDIALRTPQLWTSVRFSPEHNATEDCIRALTAELQRSGQLPLDLAICAARTIRGHDIWSDEAWTLLCAESHRWQRISLNNVPASAYEALSGRCFPALQALSIDNDVRIADIPLGVFRLESNQLSSLSICSWYHLCRLQDLPEAWPITELDLQLETENPAGLATVVQAIVAYSSTLGTCSVGVMSGDVGSREVPTQFPCLETLVLNNEAVQLCHIIACPNLKSLTINSYTVSSVQFELAFQSLLDHSSECRHLRSLSLQQLELIASHGLGLCLKRIPQLTDLELENDDSDPRRQLITIDLLWRLSRDFEIVPGSMTFLPNLERLCLWFGDALEEEDERLYGVYRQAIEDIVDSRARRRKVRGIRLAPLKSLEVFGAAKLPSFRRDGDTMCFWFSDDALDTASSSASDGD